MLRWTLIVSILMLSLAFVSACDEGKYRPNADPLGLEDSDSPDSASDPSTDLPTMSDYEEQQQDQESDPTNTGALPASPR